jgi:hypothetical protein
MTVLLLMGNTAQVLELYQKLVEDPTFAGGGCEEQKLLVAVANARNTLMSESLRAEALSAYVAETRALLAKATGLGETRCQDRRMMANVRHETAVAHLLARDLPLAEQELEASAALLEGHPYREVSVEARHVRARIALARGQHARALTELEAMERETEGERWLEAHARALAYQALAHQQAGQADRALERYARMEDALDQLTERAPLGADRAGLAAALERYTGAHAVLLIARGRAGDALELALRGRARRARLLLSRARIAGLPEARRVAWREAVASVQRARREGDVLDEQVWQLDAGAREKLMRTREQLEKSALAAIDRALSSLGPAPARPADDAARALAEHELLLTFIASGAQVYALYRRGESAHARALSAQGPDAGATVETWLSELSRALEGVQRLYVVPLEGHEAVDFHALALHGRPLAEALEVAYSQGRPETVHYRLPDGASALVLADPGGDLPSARAEADWLRTRLVQPLAQTRVLTGHIGVAALRDELGQRELFHFAGHTSFDPREPWKLGLLLGNDAKLALSDVLALHSAPPLVVLSACEGARASAGNAIGSALVAAGSRVVVAPTRTVADALSLRFSQAFYGALAGERDPVSAAHLAQALLRKQGVADWAAFRVLVP